MVERTRRLISRLSKVQREALEMAFFEGLTHAEIAERTTIPLGTIKTRIRGALHLLENLLEKSGRRQEKNLEKFRNLRDPTIGGLC